MDDIQELEIIQIMVGKSNPSFDGCVAVVDDVKPWGVVARVISPKEFGPEMFYIRLAWGEFKQTGGKYLEELLPQS